MYLLTGDTHLDDQPANEYRWQIFAYVNAARQRYPISRVFVLGDFVDRRDRHSAAFINRLFSELDPAWIILRGNHDTTIRPPAYFDFLPNYVSTPLAYDGERLCALDRSGGLLLLPFTPNPTEDWAGIDLAAFAAIFMHATVSGAVVDHGIVLDNPNFPRLPPHLMVYSGDVHHPQRVGNVTYVGAPHATKFGDSYHTRMLLVDEETFAIVDEIVLDPPRKLMLDIKSLDDLAQVQTRPGDQVKLRYAGPPGTAGQMDAQAAQWAEGLGITIVGTEVIVDLPLAAGADIQQAPDEILREFAKHEKLSEALLTVGLGLLKGVE
jgi:hypothetical protein